MKYLLHLHHYVNIQNNFNINYVFSWYIGLYTRSRAVPGCLGMPFISCRPFRLLREVTYISGMETISLKEAADIVGKDESTIRKFFNKPENKQYREIKRGKVYVSKDLLVKQYIGEYKPNHAQTPTPNRIPSNAEYRSDFQGSEGKQPVQEFAKVVAVLEQQVTELKKDKEYLQDVLREKERTHEAEIKAYNLRLHESNSLALTAQKLLPQVTQDQEQVESTASVVDYTYIAVILVLVVALVTVMLINQ
jgi:hypothetical protein